MPRLAESELNINGAPVGSIWVEAIHAEPAFEPRLNIRAGLELGESPPTAAGFPAVQDYSLERVRFRLRWKNFGGPILGLPMLSGTVREFRSAGHSAKHAIDIGVSFSHHVLEQIEKDRGDDVASFALEFSSLVVIGGDSQSLTTTPMEFSVSREMWGEFLSRSGYGEIDIIEVRRIGFSADALGRAVDHLRGARASLLRHDLNAAVGKCRMALEAATGMLGGRPEALRELLTDQLGQRVGVEYNRVITAVKQLASETFHDYGADKQFGRAEAKFVVRCTEDLIALLAGLVPPIEVGE